MRNGVLTYDQIMALQQELDSGCPEVVPLRDWMGREPTRQEAAILERAEKRCRVQEAVPGTAGVPRGG